MRGWQHGGEGRAFWGGYSGALGPAQEGRIRGDGVVGGSWVADSKNRSSFCSQGVSGHWVGKGRAL